MNFRQKGQARTKIGEKGTARKATASIDDLGLELGMTAPVAAPKSEEEVVVRTAPLEPNRSIFFGSEDEIDSALLNIRNIDQTATASGKIEVEMRLADKDPSRSISQFQRVRAWLQDPLRFGTVQPETFEEKAYPIPGGKGSYSTSYIFRIPVGQTQPAEQYFKTKTIKQLNFPSVNKHATRMGIALESQAFGGVKIEELVRTMPSDNSVKKRWKFPIDSNTTTRLNLPPTLWSRSLKDPVENLGAELARASIDLTEFSFFNANGLKVTNYSIEIELDPDTITYQKQVQKTFTGLSSQVLTDKQLSLSPAQLELLDTWSKIILTIITRRGTFLTDGERELVQTEFEAILGEKMTRGIVNQPRDLELKDLSWLAPEESFTFMAKGNLDNPAQLRLKDLAGKRIYKPLFSIPGGFYISLKADGTRYFLLLAKSGIYLTNPLSGVFTQISGEGSLSPFVRDLVPGTVLDVEVIGDFGPEGTLPKYDILVFDVLAAEGKDVRRETYTRRLEIILSIVGKLHNAAYLNEQLTAVSMADQGKTPPSRFAKSYAELFNIQAKPVYRLPDLQSALHHLENRDAEERLRASRAAAEQFFEILGKVSHASIVSSADNRLGKQYQETHGIKWQTDGTVLTPAEQAYLDTEDIFLQNRPGDINYSLVRKWKPNMTIDFLVKRNEQNILTLYTVRTKDGKGEPISLRELTLKKQGKMAAWNGNVVLDEAMEGNIIEFAWAYAPQFEDYAFVKYADRFDRPNPNPANTVIAIWNLINNPITLEDLQGLTLRRMNRYHNKVKTLMLQELAKYRNDCVLLDLGSGRGGDVPKWGDMGFVYAVEPSMTDLRELLVRAREQEGFTLPVEVLSIPSGNQGWTSFYGPRRQIHDRSRLSSKRGAPRAEHIQVINARAEDLEILKAKIDQPVHAVTMMNALTFFYESREKLQSLIETIKEFLVEGGYFYTIAFDGELFLNTLRQRPELQFTEVGEEYPTLDKIATENIVIEKVEDESCRKIWIRIAGGIVRGQHEYLINTREFVEIMAEEGFRLLEEKYLDEEHLLSAEEYWFSSCFKLLKFRALSNPVKRESDPFLLEKFKVMEASLVIDPLEVVDPPKRINSAQLQAEGIKGLLRYGNPKDGSCYLHGCLRAFSKPYKALLEDGRRGFIVQLRKELATAYTEEYHNSFGNGFFLTSQAPAYRYDVVKASLADPGFWIPSYLLPYVGDMLNLNVHVLRGIQAEVYRFGNTGAHLKPGRRNIVLYWINDNHYETVGLLEANNTVRMVFADDHPLVVALTKLSQAPQ